MARVDRALRALAESVESGEPVSLTGGTAEGNALYRRCTDVADDSTGTTTIYRGTLGGRPWCVRLLRGARLTQQRARRLLARCLTPMRASRASERVYRLARCVQARGEVRLADDLLSLSTALNERRHALIQWGLSQLAMAEGGADFDLGPYTSHCEEIRYLVGRLPTEVTT